MLENMEGKRFRIDLDALFAANGCKSKLDKIAHSKRRLREDIMRGEMILLYGRLVVASSGDVCEVIDDCGEVIWCVDTELGDESTLFPILVWEYDMMKNKAAPRYSDHDAASIFA